jgi:murein DD-endopeptidase MepM/ murein hydrolase activator NlpD
MPCFYPSPEQDEFNKVAQLRVCVAETKHSTDVLTSSCALLVACFSCDAAALEGYECPLPNKAFVRESDGCAQEGGGFRAARGSGRVHYAFDLDATKGTVVYAIHDGAIAIARKKWGKMGNTVIIDHRNGEYSVYGHLDRITVREKVTVKAGDKIGTVGYSGNADCLEKKNLSAHLHLSVFRAGQTGLGNRDYPIKLIKRWGEYWKKNYDAQLMGPINPNFVLGDKDCWEERIRPMPPVLYPVQ